MTGNKGARTVVGRICVTTAAGLLVACILGLTLVQREYLRLQHWSPIHRTRTEWPSLLATGPHGWLLSTAFVVVAILLAAFAVTLGLRSGGVLTADGAIALGVAATAAGFLGVSFPADAPTMSIASWHARVHNATYPLIPVGVTSTMLVCALARTPSAIRTTSRWIASATVACFALANFDQISQLVRYPGFLLLIGWLTILSRRRSLAQQ